MSSRRSPHQLALAAFIATAAGGMTSLIVSMRAAHRLTAPPTALDWAHAALGMLVTPIWFGGAALLWLALAERLEASALLRRGLAERPLLRKALLSVPLIGGPVYTVGYAVTAGTSAWKPGSTPLLLAAVALASGPVGRLSLALGSRGIHALRQRHRRAAAVALALFTCIAFAIWALATAPLRGRYAISQLLAFGLVTAGVALAWVAFVSEVARHRRLAASSFGALSVFATASLFIDPSRATIEVFNAERPSSWFVRAISSVMPDADADGTPGGSGLLAGGDCNDADPEVHPRAIDTPGNGQDDNCFGGDLSPRSASLFTEVPAKPGGLRADPAPLSVVVVGLDSLRFDRKFATGLDPQVTPTLARLAKIGRAYSDFRTCSPRTRESIPDLLGARLDAAGKPLASSIQALSKAGMHSAFIASDWLVRYADVPGFVERSHPHARYGHFADDEVLARLQHFLTRRPPEPFFVFAHFLGAHEPYDTGGGCQRGESDRSRYACALAELDRKLALLVRTREATGLSERSLLAVTADHGEEFGEHAGRFHAFTLYDEVLHVPLLLLGPGIEPELRTEPLACHDFLTTVLSEAGLRFAGEMADGNALSARGNQVARTRSIFERSVFEPKLHAAVHDGYKVILDRHTGLVSYFDLRRDPAEQRRLPRAPPALERELRARLDAWLSKQASEAARGSWAD